MFYNDDMGGAIRQTGMELTGAYSILLNNQRSFVWAEPQGNQFVFDGTDLNVFHENDPSLPGSVESTFGLDFNAGMMVYGKDYYFGMSVFNLLEDELGIVTGDNGVNQMVAPSSDGVVLVQRVQAWQSNRAACPHDESQYVQMDVNVRAIFNGTTWLNGLRPQDAFVLSSGLNYGAFTLAYNYDISVGDNLLAPIP